MGESFAEQFSSWIGHQNVSRERIDAELVLRFHATLWSTPLPNPETVPLGLHWCLAPYTAGRDQIGADGHPVRGLHLPPIPLPRRMWAAGDLQFLDTLRVGDIVERTSCISSITEKSGRSGTLCFVDLKHAIATSRGPAIKETQTIVYRSMPTVGISTPASEREQIPATGTISVTSDAVLLFRFSALTFNAHRIHYDRDYATKVEGYSDLVVHGPLQAALLMNFAVKSLGSLKRFSFRGINPLIVGKTFNLVSRGDGDSRSLAVIDQDGAITMRGDAWA